MRLGQILVILLVFTSKLFSQTDKDTIIKTDTIIRNRTVEKVVYIYGTPEQYLSLSSHILYNYNFYNNIKSVIKQGYCAGIDVQFEYLKQNIIYNAGLVFLYDNLIIDKTFQTEHRTSTVYTRNDTLSWYYVEIDNKFYKEYIIHSYPVDTTIISYHDSLARFNNKYYTIQLPLIIGYQFKYGFLSADFKLGLVPSYILLANDNNVYVNENNFVQEESSLLNRFNCEGLVGLNFRYLLTHNTMFNLNLNYHISLLSQYSDITFEPNKQQLGISLGVIYAFKKYD